MVRDIRRLGIGAAVLATAGAALAVAVTGSWRSAHESAAHVARDSPAWIDAIAAAGDEMTFADPRQGPLRWPGDHGPHPETRSESWQVLVHLDGGGAVQAVFNRLSLAPELADATASWRVTGAYRAHAVLQLPGAGLAAAEERLQRAFKGLAGATDGGSGVRVDHWRLSRTGDGAFLLEATAGAGHAVSLVLSPVRAVIEAGTGPDDSPVKGYAFSRMEAAGTLRTPAGVEDAAGTAWLDHYWGELPLPGAGPVAFDRWQVHLDDGRDLSLVRTRRTDGRGSAETAGFVVTADGIAEGIESGAYEIAPTRRWTDPDRGTVWPVAWRLEGPDTRLDIEAVTDDAVPDFAVPLWTGAVRIEGRLAGKEVTGAGTMQLTGYGG